MAALIDSSVLIAAEREKLNLSELATRYGDEDISLSALTAFELLHGIHRAGTPVQHRRRQAFVEGLLARLPVIAFDLIMARVHASLWPTLPGAASTWVSAT